jgi:hypothetical protein
MKEEVSSVDAGQHCADAVNLALSLGGKGKWIAIRLSDGKSDGNIYDYKQQAINHQLHEFQCAYVKIPPGGMQVDEAVRYLNVNRKLYDKGMRIADPDAGVIMPHTIEDYNIFMRTK